MRPEEPKIEAEGQQRAYDSWLGKRQLAPAHQLGSGERCELPQHCPGRKPVRKRILGAGGGRTGTLALIGLFLLGPDDRHLLQLSSILHV